MTKPTQTEATKPMATPSEPHIEAATRAYLANNERKVAPATLGGITPAKVARILATSADLRNTTDYFVLCDEIEERDPQYRALIGNVKLAVAGLPVVVESVSDNAQDTRVADAVRDVLNSPAFDSVVLNLLDGLSKGLSVCEIIYTTDGGRWIPSTIEHVPAHFFEFDAKDGKTVLLKSGKPGIAPQPLPFGKFIVHTPALKSGLPIRAGFGRAAAFMWLAKSIGLKNWVSHTESYGQPMRIGKYKPGTSKEDVATLKRAVASLGSEFAAVLPENMLIELVNAATTGNVETYERLLRYLDEQMAKLITGQTLTSGDGGGKGSFALGKVHNEVNTDRLRFFAKSVASTIKRDLVTPFVQFNFGTDVAVPNVRLHIEEPEDLVGLASILEKLVPLGLRVEGSVITDKLNLPTPAADAPVLGAQPVATESQVPVIQSTQSQELEQGGCPVHTHAQQAVKRDAFDETTDEFADLWESVAAETYAKVATSAQSAENFDELKTALVKAIQGKTVEELAELILKAKVIGKTAGFFGGNL